MTRLQRFCYATGPVIEGLLDGLFYGAFLFFVSFCLGCCL